MAGGKMAIYSGMWVKLGATDDEIAQVMGHEIGHALASHTRERMSVAYATTTVATLATVLIGSRSSNSTSSAIAPTAIATAAAVAITLPNSRESESEADQIGIELAARAGFDPRAAVTLWDKMAKMDNEKGGGPAEFLSTHPSPENRKVALQALVPKVDPLYQMAKAGKPTADIPHFIGPSSNERVVGGPSKEEYAAKLAKDPQALTFISAEFEKFKKGETVLTCATECAFGYQFQKGKWKDMHSKKQWQDLAIAVVRNGYYNDLTYFLLGEAAKGLELNDAAKIYYTRALEARKAGRTCEGVFNTCDGFEVEKLATAAMAGK